MGFILSKYNNHCTANDIARFYYNQVYYYYLFQVIFQFAFIAIVVLFAFSVAMSYLSQSSDGYHDWLAKKYPAVYSANATDIQLFLNVSYDG